MVGATMTEMGFRNLVERAGGAEALRESARAHEENLRYLEREHDNLTRKYPDQWVGILQGQVQAVASSAEEVVRVLRRDAGSMDGVVLHFMRTDSNDWLL